MEEKKEAPQTELMIIFTDKDFKFTWALDWSIDAVKSKANAKPDFLKKTWSEAKVRAYAGIAQNFPKNWKRFSDFQKAHKKWFFAQMKIQKERQKRGKLFTEKEWSKNMPRFISKTKPKDIRVIFVARNCKTNLLNFEDATYKKLQLILKPYKQ